MQLLHSAEVQKYLFYVFIQYTTLSPRQLFALNLFGLITKSNGLCLYSHLIFSLINRVST